MITLTRTQSDHPDFQRLVMELNRYLAGVNGETHDFFMQFNQTDHLRHVIVAYEEGRAVGCGAMRAFDETAMEIKRMFVPIDCRGRGVASAVLQELEQWAGELGFLRCILETARSMHDAVGLYTKAGYTVIPNYGPYAEVETSVCFEKQLPG